MKKNGFTLIELLAVIVILAIIALIATPIVINIIEDSKESATLRGAEYYINAVELSIAKNRLNNKKVEDGEYIVQDNGNICKEEECIKVEVSGEMPNVGSIVKINSGEVKEINLSFETNVVIMDATGELVFKKPIEDDKILEEANAIIAAIEASIAKEKEINSNLEVDYCSMNSADEASCNFYEWVGGEPKSILKTFDLNLEINKDVTAEFYVLGEKVSSTSNFIIGDTSFYKYDDDELFILPPITEEYAISQANKYLDAIEKAVSGELVEYPELDIEHVVDSGNSQATIHINGKLVKLQFDGLRPDILAGTGIFIEDGKVVPGGFFYMDFENITLLYENGSFSVVEL